MLTIGSNTYVSITDADEYVNDYYEKYHPLRVHWTVLDDDEKETYLRRSLAEIEKLQFLGKKYNGAYQKLQFPRIRPDDSIYSGGFFSFTYAGDSEIPEEVKQAQVENAIGIISNQISAITDKQFMTMQSLGAVKNTKYNKREAGELGFSGELTGISGDVCHISSRKAYSIIRNWLGGVRL